MGEINGILIINKEKGWTSFDVVAKMRSLLKVKKIGHTGTLDPDAEGVLVLCVGKATKLVQTLTAHEKDYEATVLFGRSTDTQDISGKVLEETTDYPSPEEAESAILSFLGGYDQIPPMYSAKKIKGKKLYELAREGVTVEREPRHVEITDIAVSSVDIPRAGFKVTCSSGTYIRTLCEDIGKKAGCPACMEELKRTRVGEFKIEKAYRVSEVEAAVREGKTDMVLLPIA